MIPFVKLLYPVTVEAEPQKNWTQRVEEAVVGAPINQRTLSVIINMRSELELYIDLALNGIGHATDDDLFALLKLRAYERQCREEIWITGSNNEE